MKELRKFICNPITNQPRRGSLTRIAEHLGVSIGTVRKWFDGEWEPGSETSEKIREMIAIPLDLTSRNLGRSGRKKMNVMGHKW